MSELTCRLCGTVLTQTFCDLGVSPLSNAFLARNQLNSMEPFFPLHVYVCEECKLVQLPEHESPQEIFSDYAYFSSFSDSWLMHARNYSEMVVERFHLDSESRVVEVASNDGYLLQYFIQKGISVYGVEPAENVAKVAKEKGIPTHVAFFGRNTAQQLLSDEQDADLIVGNNVLAHVPDINDFVAGLKVLLKRNGVITVEFPHLLRLMEERQFDTIYHEHFSYLSLLVVERLFRKHGLRVFDVEELTTHGGSLRVFACHAECKQHDEQSGIQRLRDMEIDAGLVEVAAYTQFDQKVRELKRELLQFCIEAKRAGSSIAGYGAPAKGNTLLNYCGIRTDFIDYTVDRSPYKQGRLLPGTHIPIFSPDKISETKPDYLLILPWNLKEEVMQQMAHIRSWGGKFVVPIPSVKVLE